MNTHDDDTDPTGMRALLRGLPDPGPMPDDLVDRIQASLADLPPLEGQSSAVSRGTVSSRPSWWARHGSHVAVAAVLVIGGGAVASIPWGDIGSGSVDDSAASGGSDSSDMAGDQAKTYSESDPDAAGPQVAQGGAEAVLGAVSIRQSDRDYRAEGLANQVSGGAAGATLPPLMAETPSIGPIGTEIGVRSCLEALGLPRATRADVDLGTLDGTPTAVLVVTLGGERTAYAVGRNCTTGSPSVLAGPIPLP